MRVGYSILKEIEHQHLPSASDYGLTQREFENFIFFLENKGYIERVLRVNDQFSLKAARLTAEGKQFSKRHRDYEKTYPNKSGLKAWIEVEKAQYSNGAEGSAR